MKAELVPDNGDPPIPITRDVTVVGRREFCDVVINDPSLSKRHCVLVRTDGLLLIRDLATTNGTKVKGQRIRWAALLPDDRITLGSYKLRVYLGPADAPGPSEMPRGSQRGASPRRAPASRPEPFVAAVEVDTRIPEPAGFHGSSPDLDVPVAEEDVWDEDDAHDDSSDWRDQLNIDLDDGDVIIELD